MKKSQKNKHLEKCQISRLKAKRSRKDIHHKDNSLAMKVGKMAKPSFLQIFLNCNLYFEFNYIHYLHFYVLVTLFLNIYLYILTYFIF